MIWSTSPLLAVWGPKTKEQQQAPFVQVLSCDSQSGSDSSDPTDSSFLSFLFLYIYIYLRTSDKRDTKPLDNGKVGTMYFRKHISSSSRALTASWRRWRVPNTRWDRELQSNATDQGDRLPVGNPLTTTPLEQEHRIRARPMTAQSETNRTKIRPLWRDTWGGLLVLLLQHQVLATTPPPPQQWSSRGQKILTWWSVDNITACQSLEHRLDRLEHLLSYFTVGHGFLYSLFFGKHVFLPKTKRKF
jgi:hypothetical protein